MYLPTRYDGLSRDHAFSVVAPNYSLSFAVEPNCVVLSRNSDTVRVPLAPPNQRSGRLIVAVVVAPTVLSVEVFDNAGTRTEETTTRTTFPPHALWQWARKQALLHVVEYPSAESLFASVVEQLQLLDEKIIDLGANDGFWDVSYDGSRIADTLPKRETGIHPQIRLLLADLELQRGITIVPEHPIGGGNLDFLFSGRTTSGQIVNICVEFKLAHSEKLAHGIEKQLPEYMARKKSDFGIYVVLDFGGRFTANLRSFTIPGFDTADERLDRVLAAAAINTGHQFLRPVIIKLSKPLTPSKM